MSELRELYQEVILDHYRRPRNYGELPEANREAEGHNPLCGDQVTIYLQLQDGLIQDIHFEGAGCAISTASASLMTEALKGKSVAQAAHLFENFHQLVTSDDAEALPAPDLGKLAVLAGVREFPMRVKCATLAWHTLNAALKNTGELVSTE
ncbi:Fe-S cluster assembly sulfur transfer protein SufU [Gloeobacter kilaueensis]|uniref:SUF system FeS assembly protein, NifU family n=1 Tax=Gloeobacter kilaueensis (strain ATCC BAA-2537 / CCAP 1431/1 / ULC 316 / JS1) TaxID=1183438 RepID=U5QKG0_GLOK1|nr:SUF system NifU family Fe-S cluster assembly protein [Gloeobacter kilaueensis]AGY58180.1 SUF system FeS assembly protein, NifU family [Gloeobacter kilaueensis JS1]